MNAFYSRIKVLIADDHEMVRDGLQVMAKKAEEFEIIGEARNGEELVKLARKLKPDVILTDVKMPLLSGIDATRIIKAELPHIGIIALSSFDEESLVLEMLNVGAKGYLLKNAGKKELTDAVLKVYRDEPYYCQEINHKLARIITKGGNFNKEKKTDQLFTERELEVIQLMCEGCSSKQIAGKMGVKTRTVERYRDYIMEKLGANNAISVVMYAVSNGIYKPPTQKM